MEVLDGILVVTIDNPPVNALGHQVRVALVEAAERLDAEAGLHAMIIRSNGKVFIGGADIREFGGPRLDPLLNAVCDRMEACRKPVIAAVHGAALGGGFEVALAAHFRVAAPVAEVAFPEVLLGLLPGAGGTQRAPRLCGAELALDLMLSGRRLGAPAALEAGLLDVLSDDPTSYAHTWARQLVAARVAPRRASSAGASIDRDAAHAAIAAARVRVQQEMSHLYAPQRIVECVAAAVDLPYAEGAAIEGRAFLDCLASPQREQLVTQFFAERAARKAERP